MSKMFPRPSTRKTSKPSFISYLTGENGKASGADSGPSLQVPGQVPAQVPVGGASAQASRLRPHSYSQAQVDDDRMSRASIVSTNHLLGSLTIIPDDDFFKLEPSYLPGEMMIARADRVIRFIPYSDCRQGVKGSLFVTNFRVTFMAIRRTSAMLNNESIRLIWKHKMYNEDDILLNNIEAGYHVSRGKRKKFVSGKPTDRIKKIEIHCKDLRIHQFSMEDCKKEDAAKVTNSVAHFAFPDKVDRQFAFSFKGSTLHDPASSVPDFTTAAHWERELTRLKVKNFKITDCNSQYINSQFMPKFFVVPTPITTDKITNNFKCYEDYRYPVWSYTHINGASLMRMTFPMANHINAQDEENGFLETLKQIHPEQKRAFVYDVHDTLPLVSTFLEPDDRLKLPSLKEIRSSYDKLRELCMSVTIKELESSDGSWLSSVDSTKWVAHVSSYLKVADRLVQMLTGDSYDLDKRYRRVSIVLKEHDGARDLCPLVASLVQVYMDPHARTIAGLQALIEREWVALGHKFKDRYGVTRSQDQDDKQCPVFLLFLDCLHQLVRQLPSACEYSDTFLLALWDSVCSGLYSNFLFNHQHEMMTELSYQEVNDRFSRLGDKKPTTSLLNVWDWAKQYSAEDQRLFVNPLYTKPEVVVPEEKDPPRKIRVLAQYYKEKPSDCFINLDLEEDPPPAASTILYPETSICSLELWSGFFLRWNTPVQVVGGGTSVEYILQTVVQNEIQNLQRQIDSFSAGALNLPGSSPGLTPRMLENVTSSFPFSPSRPTAQVSFFGTPIAMSPEELTSSSELESSMTSSTGGDMFTS